MITGPDDDTTAVLAEIERTTNRRTRSSVRQETTMRVIETDEAPSHTGPVLQAVEAGGWIYVSALFGADPAGAHHPGRRT
jgi:hypothetical protein